MPRAFDLLYMRHSRPLVLRGKGRPRVRAAGGARQQERGGSGRGGAAADRQTSHRAPPPRALLADAPCASEACVCTVTVYGRTPQASRLL